LFDRRWTVFAVTQNALSAALGGKDEQEKVRTFNEFKRECVCAQFLFDNDVCAYLDVIAERLAKFNGLIRAKQLGTKVDETDLQEQQVWLELQPALLANKLGRYMNLAASASLCDKLGRFLGFVS
jgi:hypothetical protein